MPIANKMCSLAATSIFLNNINFSISKQYHKSTNKYFFPKFPHAYWTNLVKCSHSTIITQSMNSKIFRPPASCRGIPASAPSPIEPWTQSWKMSSWNVWTNARKVFRFLSLISNVTWHLTDDMTCYISKSLDTNNRLIKNFWSNINA